MRRPLLGSLLVALLLAPHAHAQDAAVRAAVAPAQTVFDAAADVVDLAIREATRDGTPDEAEALLARLVRFTSVLRDDPEFLATGRYPDLARAGIAAALRLPPALRDVTVDVARLATAAERCAGGTLSPEDVLAIDASRLFAASTGERLAEEAERAPEGVDARRLAGAAARLVSWSRSHESFADCARSDPESPTSRDVLALEVRPARVHPGGQVTLRGVTNVDSSVRVQNEALRLDEAIPVVGSRFERVLVVPEDAPHGATRILAQAGALQANATLTVAPAVATLEVSAPARVEPNSTITLHARLASPLPALTDDARLLLEGDAEGEFLLAGGEGTTEIAAGPTPRTLRLLVVYPGTHVVARAEATALVEVAAAPLPPPEAERLRFPELGAAAWVAIAATVLLAAGAAAWRLRPREAPLESAAARGGGVDAPRKRVEDVGPPPAASGIIGLVVALARLLRRLGRASPATTAREMGPQLDALGVPSGDVVERFERARYGGAALAEAPEDRTWFDRAWARLKEGLA